MKRIAVGLAALLLCGSVLAKPKERSYNLPVDKVYATVLHVAVENYHVTHSSKEDGLVSFEAGSFKFNALITTDGKKTTVTVSSQSAPGDDFAAFGTGRAVDRFFDKLEKALK
jgi:hypothetical protein